jgi:redox-sensing transcriptional repressor
MQPGSSNSHSHNGGSGNLIDVPEVVILRLPQYLRVLSNFEEEGIEVISSEVLGIQLQMTSAQIRKDLSYFGRFGKQGRGYRVGYLKSELREILGLNQEWNVCLVGVGRLGAAIIGYTGFVPQGFRITAAFDIDPLVVGKLVGGLKVQPFGEMASTIQQKDIRIAILAVPASQAKEVVDSLVESHVKAILSYAPITVQAPEGIKVRTVDPVLALQSMPYYIGAADSGVKIKVQGL